MSVRLEQLVEATHARLQERKRAQPLEELERAGATKDPQRAQAALARLTAEERRAYLEAAGDEGALPEPVNRQQRRAMQRMQKQRRR